MLMNIGFFMKPIGKAILVLLILIGVYAIAFKYSLYKVDHFCSSITTSTKINELNSLAHEYGITLMGPTILNDESGKHIFAAAVSPFTFGDYGCFIDGDSLDGTVTEIRLGY